MHNEKVDMCMDSDVDSGVDSRADNWLGTAHWAVM